MSSLIPWAAYLETRHRRLSLAVDVSFSLALLADLGFELDPLDIAVRDYSVVGVFSARLTPEELARTHSEVIALAQEGRINTPIGKVFPFQDVPAALTYLTSDDLMGRVIVEIS